MVRSGDEGTAIAITGYQYRSNPTHTAGIPRVPAMATADRENQILAQPNSAAAEITPKEKFPAPEF